MTPSMAGIAAGSLTIIAGVTSLPGIYDVGDCWADSCRACDADVERLVAYQFVVCCACEHFSSLCRSEDLDADPERV